MGTWTNGKTIYRKGITKSYTSPVNNIVIDNTLTSSVVDTVIHTRGSIIVQADTGIYITQFPYNANNMNKFVYIAPNGLRLTDTNPSQEPTSITVMIYYTKK